YHIDTLEGIVARDSSKRYSLTKPGQEVYEYLKANPEAVSVKDVPPNFKRSGRLRDYAETIIAPRNLSLSLPASNRRSLFSLALSAISSTANLSANRDILTVALVIFQAWSATILAAGISISSSVRIEKSIMASLIVLYTTMILVFVLGSGF